MTTSAIESAAQFLYAARTGRRTVARVPEASRPADVAQGLAIQRRVAELIRQPIGGWKCSLPSEARSVLAAPIFAPTIVDRSPCAILTSATTARIEPEIAFVLARDLPSRSTPYSEDDVRNAVGDAHLVLELLGARYIDPSVVSFPELLADNVANQGLFVGPVLANAFAQPLAGFPITVGTPTAVLIACAGKHPDAHPLRPLVWLANYLAVRGDHLKAGQIVTTGSYAGALQLPLGEALTIRFGDLGAITVTLVAAA